MAVVRKPGEGDAFWFLGGLYEVKVSSDETDGAVTVMQMTIPSGMGPPPHRHDCAETVNVLDGTALFHIEGETVEAGPGSVLHFPAGTLETFDSTGTVELLLTYQPGGMDKFFAEAGERAASRVVPPAPESPPDLQQLAEVAARHGLELQAPPD